MEKWRAKPVAPTDGGVVDWISYILEWIYFALTFQWIGLLV